ncbi:hypothetical protein GSI_07062 [Ganoderma sinense ZZ0214-1]|uniref:Uncharacterized protein n=1 Tax=Ganoderma sinense ZZ0214-1 TaxID=1077348 RepID=A0A2G8SAY1_9APHY|nr:hypothetical protein GSI_07062 [Ganoderma sinense ZZ0214-1]
MEHEIEEAQRQIRRSAAIIQDAFEGLTTLQRLHNRVSEASPSARAPTDTSSAISSVTQPTQDRVGSPAMPPNSMDPGHDVIVISAENSTLPPPSSTSTSIPTSQTQSRTSPSSAATSPSPRGPRPADPALAVLGTELRTMTQSFRERVGEFDELRRAIAQYAQERHSRGVTAERTRSRSPPPNTDPYNPAPFQPLYPDTSSSFPEVVPTGPAQAASGMGVPRRFDGRIRPIRGELRAFDRSSSLLRPRDGNESETSLGILVAARTAASSNNNSVADTPTITPASISASARSTGDRPRPVAFPVPFSVNDLYENQGARPASRVLPSNITARITRLAQEIQQEGARITQQAESLRSWINDRNARLDALRPSASVSAAAQAPRPITTRRVDSNPTIVHGEEYGPAPTIPAVTAPPRFSARVTDPPLVAPSQIPRASEPDPVGRPRRAPEGAVRARYLRQSVPTTWSATSSSASVANLREDPSAAMVWSTRRERATDGPLSPPSRTIGPTGNRGGLRDAGTSTSMSMSASPGTIFDDFEIESYSPADVHARAAAAIARMRTQRRVIDAADDDEDFTDSRSYRVRRRFNADGDEEIIRVSLGPDISSSPGSGSGLSLNRRRAPLDLDDDSGEEDSWMEAISRLDTMSRRSAARPAEEWQPPRMVRSGTQMGTTAPSPAAFSVYPNSLAGRRSTRGWPRLSYGDEDALFAENEAQYERDLSAMRSRAQALLSSSTAPTRSLGGTTLPPPPPTTRPLFVPTTQAPGSLWNDNNVRVRLRTRVNEALERQIGAGDAPTPPLERSRRERNGRDGAPRVRAHHQAPGSETERPMWGSPTPFYPSALPLPLVEDVGNLQARIRVFGGAEKIARMPRKRAVSQVGR